MKIYVIRALAVLLAMLLVVTAAACTPPDGVLETNPIIGESTAAPDGTSAPTDTPTDGETEGEAANTAPDFTVQDGEGNSVKLSDFFGKPIVFEIELTAVLRRWANAALTTRKKNFSSSTATGGALRILG